MSIIKDLLNGITPQKRKVLEELKKENQQRQFEREQELYKENLARMKSADATLQMANWVTETLLSITTPHYWKRGIIIEIERTCVNIYDVIGIGTSDGCNVYESKYFSSLGYEPIPDGCFSPFCTALIELVNITLSKRYYSIEYYNPCYGGKYRYSGCRCGYLVKSPIIYQREQLNTW